LGTDGCSHVVRIALASPAIAFLRGTWAGCCLSTSRSTAACVPVWRCFAGGLLLYLARRVSGPHDGKSTSRGLEPHRGWVYGLASASNSVPASVTYRELLGCPYWCSGHRSRAPRRIRRRSRRGSGLLRGGNPPDRLACRPRISSCASIAGLARGEIPPSASLCLGSPGLSAHRRRRSRSPNSSALAAPASARASQPSW